MGFAYEQKGTYTTWLGGQVSLHSFCVLMLCSHGFWACDRISWHYHFCIDAALHYLSLCKSPRFSPGVPFNVAGKITRYKTLLHWQISQRFRDSHSIITGFLTPLHYVTWLQWKPWKWMAMKSKTSRLSLECRIWELCWFIQTWSQIFQCFLEWLVCHICGSPKQISFIAMCSPFEMVLLFLHSSPAELPFSNTD